MMKYLAAGKQRCCHDLWPARPCHVPQLQPDVICPSNALGAVDVTQPLCSQHVPAPSAGEAPIPEPARVGLQLISHVVEAKPNELHAGAWEGRPSQVPVEREAVGMGAFGMKIKETKVGLARWDPQGFKQSYGRMEKPTEFF